MTSKFGPQNNHLEAIKKNLSSSEEQRRKIRFEFNLNKFIDGSIQTLKNDEFVQTLVGNFIDKSVEISQPRKKLLESLGVAVVSPDVSIRERALAILSVITESFLDRADRDEILEVVNVLCKWLEYETELLPGLPIVIKRLEELTAWLLEKSLWKDGEMVVKLFHSVQMGNVEKNKAFRMLVTKSVEKLATKKILEQLTDCYLLEGENQPVSRNILVFFEHKAVVYILKRIIQSLSRKVRLALVSLLTEFGGRVLPIAEDCLKSNPPWAVVRNILCVLAEIGDDACYGFVKQYYHHPDKRVQYELISCVQKLGGSALTNRLLEGLPAVTDELKVLIIQMLVEHSPRDMKILHALNELFFKDINAFSSTNNKVIVAAIAALKFFPTVKSIEILRNIHDDCAKLPQKEPVLLQIEEALKYMRPQLRHKQQRSVDSHETVSFDSDPQQTQKALNRLADIEKHLQKLVGAGDLGAAGRLLNDQALSAARTKDFFLAEKLRDRLLEINPMALGEAVALGELIEEEKKTSYASHHLGVWGELYEEMETAEFDAVYSVLRQEEYRKDDIIVRAGEIDDVLYLVNSGYVNLSCVFSSNEIFLKRMGPGSILGANQFFSASVWTVSLRANSDVSLHLLDYKDFLRVTEDYPGMEEKLRRYCQKYEGVPQLLKMSGDDRREYPRFPLTLFTQNILFDPFGNKGKRKFKGELIDVSRNGLAFIIKISSRNNAKQLLGRHIVSEIQQNEGDVLTKCSGVIVGVRYHDIVAKDSTIHVKLSQKIEEKAFSQILAQRRPVL